MKNEDFIIRASIDLPGIIVLCLCVFIYFITSYPKCNYYDQVMDGYSLTAFGSKTAYKNNGLKPMHESVIDGRRVIQVNALYRHGTRSPGVEFSKDAEKLRTDLQRLCPKLDFSLRSCGSGDKALLEPGVKEIQELGHRLRSTLPDDFRNGSRIVVISSETERTLDSAKAFLSTFTDDSVPITKDSARVRFFAQCNNYISQVRSNKETKKEYKKFQNGKEMQQVLREVVSDNGLEELQLTTDDIAFVYKVAAYEVSAMQEGEPLPGWVRLFRPEHLYVLEYLHDLKQYWTKGNAVPLNYEQVCPLWGAIMEDFVKAANEDMELVVAHRSGDESAMQRRPSSAPRSVLWFGHAETLLPLVAKLDLFNESVASPDGGGRHLSADGFPTRLSRIRTCSGGIKSPVFNLYRSSHIIPFAGNMAFFLFHCPAPNVEPSLNDYCLEVRLNEQVVDIIPRAEGLSRPLRLPEVLHYFHSCRPTVYKQELLCGAASPALLKSKA